LVTGAKKMATTAAANTAAELKYIQVRDIRRKKVGEDVAGRGETD
jgi:hypothetical protein